MSSTVRFVSQFSKSRAILGSQYSAVTSPGLRSVNCHAIFLPAAFSKAEIISRTMENEYKIDEL